MVLERKGPVSTATRNCQNHLQRLRSMALATTLPGSQGQDPRTLRPERLKWLSIPFPVKSHRRKNPELVRGCWMGSTDPAKNEPAAQIAAPNTCEASVSRCKATAVCLQTAIALPSGASPASRVLRRAFAHHTTTIFFDGRKGQSLAGTDPSTFFSKGRDMR